MKRIIVSVALLLLPMAAGAQTFNVNLDGGAGTGFATIIIDGSDIDYTIITSGLDPAPSSAELTDGSDIVDLAASFGGTGTAIGTVNSGLASDIAGNPSVWTLNVSNGTDILSGVVASGGGGAATELYFPVAATTAGAQGTNWKTDARIINRSGEIATVTFEYYPDGADGNSGPSDTETFTVAANQQMVLTNFVEQFFGVTNGKGGVKVVSDRQVVAAAKVYNDQTEANEGTYGLFVDAVDMSQGYTSGVLSFLQNRRASSGEGFRGAVGWFNPTSSTLSLTLRAYDTDGTFLGETTEEVAGLAQQQSSIQGLWSELAGYGDMYITYSADGAIFVYGTITDNISGDGSYIPATQSP
jgi:hypothetical protein